MSPSPLHPDVVKAIRGVGIGYHLPRVRTHRAGRRKQRKISVVVGGDFVGKSNKASRIVNFKNLIRVPITRFDSVHSTDLSVALFNAQSVGQRVKRSAVSEYILSNGTDILCVTETWLRGRWGEVPRPSPTRPFHYLLSSLHFNMRRRPCLRCVWQTTTTLSLHQCLFFQPYLLRACTSVTVTRAVSSQRVLSVPSTTKQRIDSLTLCLSKNSQTF